MIRRLAILVAAGCSVATVGATAQTREVRDGELVGIDSAKAYILYHLPEGEKNQPAQPIFMRMSKDRIASEQLLFAARNGRTFAKVGSVRVHLLEVTPGDYLLYGLSMAGAAPTLATCFCLGTVSFNARPGMVTDVGAILIGNARALSGFPELAGESGFGPSIDTGFWHPVAAIRIVSSLTLVSDRLPRGKVEPATFRAMGRFFDPRTTYVNRLAPLSGVLRYDGGKPIDVASGAPLQDHFAP
jgi:hypothetical protein